MKITLLNIQLKNLNISHKALIELLAEVSDDVLFDELSSYEEVDIPVGDEALVIYHALDDDATPCIAKSKFECSDAEVSPDEFKKLVADYICTGIAVAHPDDVDEDSLSFISTEELAKSWACNKALAPAVSKDFDIESITTDEYAGLEVWLTYRKKNRD